MWNQGSKCDQACRKHFLRGPIIFPQSLGHSIYILLERIISQIWGSDLVVLLDLWFNKFLPIMQCDWKVISVSVVLPVFFLQSNLKCSQIAMKGR